VRSDGVRARAAATTRQQIIDAAQLLFSEYGYAAVSIHEIVTSAKVTRGALYHHFEDKRALFRAVFEAVEVTLSARASPQPDSPEATDPWKRYRLRIQGFLDAILRPEFHRVLLVDGPAVLGWTEWRELESRYGLGAIGRALNLAMEAGCITKQPSAPLAHIILAAINETALLIINSADRTTARHEAGGALDAFLAGLAS
jgi:AcrR family transcriptional regulator